MHECKAINKPAGHRDDATFKVKLGGKETTYDKNKPGGDHLGP